MELQLFSPEIWQTLTERHANVNTQVNTQVSPITVSNPCIDCPLLEWCDDDECAMKLYPLDQDENPKYYVFEDWLCEPIS